MCSRYDCFCAFNLQMELAEIFMNSVPALTQHNIMPQSDMQNVTIATSTSNFPDLSEWVGSELMVFCCK